jgi:hypothetical protein
VVASLGMAAGAYTGRRPAGCQSPRFVKGRVKRPGLLAGPRLACGA